MNIREMIQPVVDVADTFVPNDDASGWVQANPEGTAFIKPLWASADSGGWAALFRWSAGYIAPPHKHQGAIHAFIVSGRLRVRDHEMGPGDYTYEPNGIIHDATEAVEDTVHLNIGDGPILFFDNSGITRYFGWEQVMQLQARADGQLWQHEDWTVTERRHLSNRFMQQVSNPDTATAPTAAGEINAA